jgi:uncharacterized membrane protein YbhN (UPF0104 family)
MYGRLRPSFRNRRSLLRIAATIATLAISAAILGGLIYSQRDTLSELEFQINLYPLLATSVLFTVNLFLVAIIWGWIFNSLGERIRFWKHIRIYFLSNLTKRLPGTVWYIASRAEFYRRDGVSRRLTTAASGVEFTIALLTSAIVAVVLAFSFVREIRLGFVGIGVVILLAFIVSQPRVIHWIFKKLRVEVSNVSTRSIVGWILSYIFAWFLAGAVVFSIGLIFYEIPIADLGFVIGSVALTNLVTAALFFAPSNLGITEISLTFLLSRIMPAPYALIVSIATRLIIVALEAIWAVILIWFER